MGIAAIVLAAGKASRFAPGNKLTACIAGTPIVRRVVNAAIGSGAAPIVIVTGYWESAVRASLADLPVLLRHNPAPDRGLSSSIQVGMARSKSAEYLTKYLSNLSGIVPPLVRPGVRHGYYVYSLIYNAEEMGSPREKFVAALNAEGIPMVKGYVEPLYLLPCYQQRIAFGNGGFPFTYQGYKGTVSYSPGICPVAEKMHFEELMYTNICHANITRQDLDDFIAGFEKVVNNVTSIL